MLKCAEPAEFGQCQEGRERSREHVGAGGRMTVRLTGAGAEVPPELASWKLKPSGPTYPVFGV